MRASPAAHQRFLDHRHVDVADAGRELPGVAFFVEQVDGDHSLGDLADGHVAHVDVFDDAAADARAARERTPAPMRTCRRCSRLFRPAQRVCPTCGLATVQQLLPLNRDGQLAELERERKFKTLAEWRATTGPDERYSMFRTWADTARQRGYKPGWALVKFKTVFGEMPPYQWSRAV